MGDEERPPQGCAPDTYKLFLANIPKNWDIPELRNVLDGYGQVKQSSNPSPVLCPLALQVYVCVVVWRCVLVCSPESSDRLEHSKSRFLEHCTGTT